MPVLYCRPVNNLANRMMSIASAWRLARLWDYEFRLIWDWGPETLFACSYETLFEAPFAVQADFGLEGHTLQLPPRNANGRHFYARPDGGDVFLSGWGHLTLCESDRALDALQVTAQLREALERLFVPTQAVRTCCENLGYAADLRFDLGVHVRRGAPEFDHIAGNAQILRLAQEAAQQRGLRSFFVASTEPASADFFGQQLRAQGAVFVSRGYSNEPSFRNHALAIYDLLFFSRCREILKTGATTYSSLAGLMGGSILNTVNEQGACIRHPAHYGVGAGL